MGLGTGFSHDQVDRGPAQLGQGFDFPPSDPYSARLGGLGVGPPRDQLL